MFASFRSCSLFCCCCYPSANFALWYCRCPLVLPSVHPSFHPCVSPKVGRYWKCGWLTLTFYVILDLNWPILTNGDCPHNTMLKIGTRTSIFEQGVYLVTLSNACEIGINFSWAASWSFWIRNDRRIWVRTSISAHNAYRGLFWALVIICEWPIDLQGLFGLNQTQLHQIVR